MHLPRRVSSKTEFAISDAPCIFLIMFVTGSTVEICMLVFIALVLNDCMMEILTLVTHVSSPDGTSRTVSPLSFMKIELIFG